MYEIVGAAMDVYNILGRGLAEQIYQEALGIELRLRGIDFEREKILKTYYKDILLEKTYKVDFISNDILIELKTVDRLNSDHRAQLFNYLRLTKSQLGVLINFGERQLRCERYVYQPQSDDFLLLTSQNVPQVLED